MTDHQPPQPALATSDDDWRHINPLDGTRLPDTQRAYKANSGKIQVVPSIELLTAMDDEGEGFCLACGYVQDGCEPDMTRGICEHCGHPKVFGAAELGLRGLCF